MRIKRHLKINNLKLRVQRPERRYASFDGRFSRYAIYDLFRNELKETITDDLELIKYAKAAGLVQPYEEVEEIDREMANG